MIHVARRVTASTRSGRNIRWKRRVNKAVSAGEIKENCTYWVVINSDTKCGGT
jgi:hypothetical protein